MLELYEEFLILLLLTDTFNSFPKIDRVLCMLDSVRLVCSIRSILCIQKDSFDMLRYV